MLQLCFHGDLVQYFVEGVIFQGQELQSPPSETLYHSEYREQTDDVSLYMGFATHCFCSFGYTHL